MLLPMYIVQDLDNRHMNGNYDRKNLKSSISIWLERWFLSTNAKDIGTCAARASGVVLLSKWYVSSDITNLLHLTTNICPTVLPVLHANNRVQGKADTERMDEGLLPGPNTHIRGNWHGYDEKLDTYRSAWVSHLFLSRISRRGISKLKAGSERTGPTCSSETEGHSNEESLPKTYAQEPKSDNTILWTPEDGRKGINRKKNNPGELSDSSALKRERTPHSSPGTKDLISQIKEVSEKESTRGRGSRSPINNRDLRMFVTSKLDQYKTKGKYNGIIRILADPGFLQYCYMLIKGKPGNMSVGTTKETLDGIEYEWFCKVSKELLTGSYKFSPAKRVIIPKPGKPEGRPLGVGAPREKIVQKGLQIILEAIYEPKFRNCSHGFRPNRSTHSALRPIYLKGHQFKWVIQGDISKCFDRIPHDKILELITKDISCDRTLSLIKKALTVGYIEKKTKTLVKTNIGTPQGSVLSPLLANIVLNKLDEYLEDIISPRYHRGRTRGRNPEYTKLTNIRYKKSATEEEKKTALEQMYKTPSTDVNDPNFRRIMYIRYADDFVILFEGPISEAKDIKTLVKDFLAEHTGLELNEEKTIVTNIKKGFNFLGAYIKNLRRVDYRMRTRTVKGTPITMRANVRARVNMPTRLLVEKLIKAGFAKRNHQKQIIAAPQTKYINLDHATIIQHYNSKIHGILNYYSFAANRIEIQNLIWILRFSFAKTLSRKYKLGSARQAFKKFGPLLKDPATDLEIYVPKSLPAIHKYNNTENLTPVTETLDESWYGRLTSTNVFKKCTICDTPSNVQMHHLRSVKDVRAKMTNHKSTFQQWIGATKRKQIPLCQYHHNLYHQGKLLN